MISDKDYAELRAYHYRLFGAATQACIQSLYEEASATCGIGGQLLCRAKIVRDSEGKYVRTDISTLYAGSIMLDISLGGVVIWIPDEPLVDNALDALTRALDENISRVIRSADKHHSGLNDAPRHDATS